MKGKGRQAFRQREPEARINERIRAPEVRVVTDGGEQLGVMKIDQALAAAQERSMDLVEIASNAEPPVCKIMDYGKFKYLQKKKAHDAKKHQHQTHLKEVKFRPKIEKHDYAFKLRHAREFLVEGNKVKITVRFRGREITRPELARKIISRVEEDTKDLAQMEQQPNFEGRTMIAILAPLAMPSKKGKKPAGAGAKPKRTPPAAANSGASPSEQKDA